MARRPRHKLTKLTTEQKEARLNARWKIIRTANNHIMQVHAHNPYIPTMLELKHIQRAVHICRQAMIIDGKTLIEAGFQPHAAKPGVPTMLKKLIGRG